MRHTERVRTRPTLARRANDRANILDDARDVRAAGICSGMPLRARMFCLAFTNPSQWVVSPSAIDALVAAVLAALPDFSEPNALTPTASAAQLRPTSL